MIGALFHAIVRGLALIQSKGIASNCLNELCKVGMLSAKEVTTFHADSMSPLLSDEEQSIPS